MKRVRKHTHSVQRHRLCQRPLRKPWHGFAKFLIFEREMLQRLHFRDSLLGNETLFKIWWLICLLTSIFLNFVCQQSQIYTLWYGHVFVTYFCKAVGRNNIISCIRVVVLWLYIGEQIWRCHTRGLIWHTWCGKFISENVFMQFLKIS